MRAAMKRVECYEKSCNNEDGACDFSSGKIVSSSTGFCLTETVLDDDGSFVSTQTSAAQPHNLPGRMGTFSPHKNSKNSITKLCLGHLCNDQPFSTDSAQVCVNCDSMVGHYDFDQCLNPQNYEGSNFETCKLGQTKCFTRMAYNDDHSGPLALYRTCQEPNQDELDSTICYANGEGAFADDICYETCSNEEEGPCNDRVLENYITTTPVVVITTAESGASNVTPIMSVMLCSILSRRIY